MTEQGQSKKYSVLIDGSASIVVSATSFKMGDGCLNMLRENPATGDIDVVLIAPLAKLVYVRELVE